MNSCPASLRALIIFISLSFCAQSQARPGLDQFIPYPSPGMGFQNEAVILDGLTTVTDDLWTTDAVRHVLQSFAFGGHASDKQIAAWAAADPEKAIVEILNFDSWNPKLSAPLRSDRFAGSCKSLTELQQFWSSDDARNPVRLFDRPYFALLSEDITALNTLGVFLVWSRAMHTRGCNQFLHNMAFYLTNYHASIHVQNTGGALIRDYYDDTVEALRSGEDFIGLMFNAAKNGALAFAYGHATNYVSPQTGEFFGNDDFAREYFQLLFAIQGTTEDVEYHEGVTIENNSRLLTGMFLDQQPDRFGSTNTIDWFVSDLDFTDHVDPGGRQIYNRSGHFDFRKGAESCLEILHQPVCGANAEDKLRALGPIAASHPESMANVPLKLVRHFGDTIITPDEAQALQTAWADAEFDVLRFIRAYAVSTLFHSPDTFRYWSAFERNLIVQNATLLSNEESFARPFFYGPLLRMFEQNALVFAPIRDVFGGQTGNDAANNRYVFKSAWDANVENVNALAAVEEVYLLEQNGTAKQWNKRWDLVIPTNAQGEHVVSEVSEWLWNRYITDGGVNFDALARAQVYSLLATGFDFATVVDGERPDALFSSADMTDGDVSLVYLELAGMTMDLNDPVEQHHIGMAINFISMLPFAFGSGGNAP